MKKLIFLRNSKPASLKFNLKLTITTVDIILFQDSIIANGQVPTPNTEIEAGVVTPRKKSVASDDVIIDMHLNNKSNHNSPVKRI